MAIIDIFSKRQSKLRGETPDVYIYDELPQTLRTQVVHIWNDALGDYELSLREPNVGAAYQAIVEILHREYGVFELCDIPRRSRGNSFQELVAFFLQESKTERALDAIELSFRMIDGHTRDFGYLLRQNGAKLADDAIEELNTRLKEHGIGYQYTNGEMIRVDSELLHSEVVKPALRLLSGKEYAGAQQEFLKAHEHYRSGNTKEALNEALKAFENTMKIICDRRGWKYDSSDSAKDLIGKCFANELIPRFWESSFSSLRSLLESSVPTGRNKLSGHGQGQQPVDVPNYIAAYVLHMTASAIVLLREAESAL